jgi:hypothetical protein
MAHQVISNDVTSAATIRQRLELGSTSKGDKCTGVIKEGKTKRYEDTK